jgi:hypothetical protein
MENTMSSATQQVDVLVLNPQNRKLLVDTFADWLNRRADVALEAMAIQCTPLAAQDAEIGLTKESLANDARAAVASEALWRSADGAATDPGAVDAALLLWASRLHAGSPGVPAWFLRRDPR